MGVKKAWVVFGTVLGVWLCYSSLDVAAQLTDPKEVTALLAIRRSLNDPVGCLKNWKKGDPCTSKWYGVLCFNVIESDGYLHVKELQLINVSLSGSLSPELGRLSYMKILDFMWNKISGTIPKEIGSISSLELLLLNGNELSGSLPEELGDLSNLNRIQIDENNISGPIPKSFGNLNNTKHIHLNNNSLSGQIPPELSKISSVVHLLLDNNNLSGNLPPQFSELPNLRILQLDNNHFHGTIPDSYRNMSKLLKMSLRNCGLQGPVPDLSSIPKLLYLDLGHNQLNGSIPSNKLSVNITTIDLSNNHLNGPIPANFSGLFRLQRLLLENNSLSGDVPSNIWQNRSFSGNESLILDFRNNKLSGVSDTLNPPTNVSIRLQSNPVCEVASQPQIVQFCGSQSEDKDPQISTDTQVNCWDQSCPDGYEYVKNAPIHCFCAAPLRIGIRLKSPGISDFVLYENQFQAYLTSGILLDLYQLSIVSFIWEPGPRLRMYLKLFPEYNTSSHMFNDSEILRLRSMFTGWKIPDKDIFGPRELLNFTLLRPYQNGILDSPKSGIKKRDLIEIVLGAIVGSIVLYAVILIFIKRIHARRRAVSKNGSFSNSSIVVDGVKGFTFVEMLQATNNFNSSNHVGKGGYGDVYKGILADGRTIAVKRAVIDSFQGEKEFLTEIELLSRVHHRNLVSLVGYCVEKGEQMLVYEFMPNGTLRDHLSVKSVESLSFSTRLNIALGSAKGVLYLHTAADPPIFHRDIKASNILLDSKFTAKVADFGLSKLAPVPDVEGNVLCHVSTVVKGTAGYLDPEYLLTHDYTDKSDVYSLGIVFLELVTGMQPISHGKNIVREVNKAYQSGMIFSIIDARMGSYPSECVERFLTLALKCCKGDTVDRPSMGEVVRDLEEINFLMSDSTPGTSASMVTDPASFGFQSYSSQLSSKGKNIDMSSDISGSDIADAISDIITAR